MSKDDETYCRTAVQNYNRLKPVVLEGDMLSFSFSLWQ